MFQFVNWLKMFAAMFITNAHYADIWPISALAHGGHLGNCLFFLVSGFCLYHIKDRFPKWYLKRVIRIYPALWIVVAVDLLVGRISVGSLIAVLRCCIFPTWYHFITSIMILYIAYYVVRSLQKKFVLNASAFVVLFAGIFFLWYLFVFDKSTYHIDNGEEARFQFFQSMLLGAMLREKYEDIDSKIRGRFVVGTGFWLVLYFCMKVVVSKLGMFVSFQFMIPVALVLLVFHLALLAIKLEKRGFFSRVPAWANRVSVFMSGITLEIYLGQNLILYKFTHLPFPANFFVVTGLIVLYAWVIHKCASRIQSMAMKKF